MKLDFFINGGLVYIRFRNKKKDTLIIYVINLVGFIFSFVISKYKYITKSSYFT